MAGVHVQRQLRAAGPGRTVRRRQFAQQAEVDQVGGVPGDGGRAEPGGPSDGGTGQRAAGQYRAQYRTGTAALDRQRAAAECGGSDE